MKTIIKRLEHLEHARQTQMAARSVDARALLMEKLNGVAERMRAGGNRPPEPRPTVEEVKQHIKESFARRDERPRPGSEAAPE
jgi:hypothetical protein